jgi:transcription antitermination factor NusG
MPDATLRFGQKVRLLASPFVDPIGTVLYVAPKDRVRLLPSILGQDVSTRMSRWMVAPVA